MASRMRRLTIVATIVVSGMSCTICLAQESKVSKTSVLLHLNKQFDNQVDTRIDFENGEVGSPKSESQSGESDRIGRAPGGVLISLKRLEEPVYVYKIKVDSNADGDLANDAEQLIAPGSSVKVMATRTWGQKKELLTYTITYLRDLNRKNEPQENFYWRPAYRAEGELRVNRCKALLVVVDINGDGIFDRSDFSRGTTIGLDRNGDGVIYGADEWLVGEQIIEYCGTSMLIETLESDGSEITLAETRLRVPKIGNALPSLSVTTTGGKRIDFADLRGKVIVLDFWVSWCKPCVAEFGTLKQLYKKTIDRKLGWDFEIIGINVDEPSRLRQAQQIIEQYQLVWPQVLTSKGAADSVWKTFGGIEQNQLAIPLYVLADRNGVIKYAGNGGADLSELKHRIQELEQNGDSKRQ